MHQRNFGLDVLRSLAIIGVVLFHSSTDLPDYKLGLVVPVELFFALSGYLIAQMIVERFDRISTTAAFWAFMKNRWLRTLPLYWPLVVAQGIVLAGTVPWTLTLQDAFFVQNLWIHDQIRYGMSPIPVAWSLCIEEWFYLLCPLALLWAGRRSITFWQIAGIGLIVLTIGLRLGRFLTADTDGQLGQIYYYRMPTLMRLDVFVYGAAAYAAMQGIFANRRNRLLAALAGLALTVLNFAIIEAVPNGAYVKILLPSTSPLAMALIIPFMVHIELTSARWPGSAWWLRSTGWLRNAAAWLSTRTYAIYLIHMSAFNICLDALHPRAWQFALAIALILAVAELLHVYVERPMMARRPLRAPQQISSAPAA